MGRVNKQQLTSSVDSLHGSAKNENSFKEKGPRRSKGNAPSTPTSTTININPTHQFMDVITKASKHNQTYDTEDFPTPPANKYVYSVSDILHLWKPTPLPADTVINPETTTEKALIPVCKDDSLQREFRDVGIVV